ncbi:MAG: M16 family metallopeptidase [Syntrophobacteraceae bacterium]
MNRRKTFITVLVFMLLLLSGVHCPAMPAVERITLPNGLKLLVFEDHSVPAVTLDLLVAAGSWRDPQNGNGLANLTLKSLLLGTRYFSFAEINSKLDFIGANVYAECSKDFAVLGMQMLKKDLDSGSGLFFEMAMYPSFQPDDIVKEKDDIIGKLRSTEDDPMDLANRAFERSLFINSPYAGDVEGTEKSVKAISPDHLAKFYGSFYRPNNAILVIGGDITPEEVKARIVPKLLPWQKADIPEIGFSTEFPQGTTTVKIDKPVSQATIVIGSPALERSNKDYYAFMLLNQILGAGSLSSRLMVEIRVKSGLAYAVESILLARKYSGSFRIVLQTKESSAQDAISLALKEVERVLSEPVSDAEIERAKKFLIGNFPLKYGSRQQDYAKFLAQVEFYGLGAEYPEKYPAIINELTPQDLHRVAQKYLKREKVTVIVSDLQKATIK